jgi:hypothetical protein
MQPAPVIKQEVYQSLTMQVQLLIRLQLHMGCLYVLWRFDLGQLLSLTNERQIKCGTCSFFRRFSDVRAEGR